MFHEWRVESGRYQIQICENAGTVLLEQAVTVKGAKPCIKASLGTPMSMLYGFLPEEKKTELMTFLDKMNA